MDDWVISLAVFVAVVAVAVASSILIVRRDGRGTNEFIKRLLIWVSIAALLPLTATAGATMLHPRTKLVDLMAQQQRVNNETYDSNDPTARSARRDESEALRKKIDDERRAFYAAMFWVAFPIGYLSLVVGLLLPHVSVGSGIALGGLSTLTAGCYSFWDDMGDSLRFFSLLLVLITVVAIGLIKFGRPIDLRPTPFAPQRG